MGGYWMHRKKPLDKKLVGWLGSIGIYWERKKEWKGLTRNQ